MQIHANSKGKLIWVTSQYWPIEGSSLWVEQQFENTQASESTESTSLCIFGLLLNPQ